MHIFQVNTKFLAPLFLAYDDRLKEKEQLIRTYDVSNMKPDRQKECVAKTQSTRETLKRGVRGAAKIL